MKLILLLFTLSFSPALLIAADADDKQLSDAEKKAAEKRADDLIKEMAEKRLSVDPATKKDLDQIDLLTRKAEAYVLVEQPADAGRMLSAAQELITTYEKDKRTELRQAIKGYEKRLTVVAQAVLKYTATIDLDEKDDSEETKETESDKNPTKDVSTEKKEP